MPRLKRDAPRKRPAPLAGPNRMDAVVPPTATTKARLEAAKAKAASLGLTLADYVRSCVPELDPRRST